MTIYQDGPKGLVGYKIGLGSSNCEVLSHNILDKHQNIQYSTNTQLSKRTIKQTN